MKIYLHLADSGLVLSDLSLRAYDTEGNVVSLPFVTLTAQSSGIDYVLDGIPGVPGSYAGLTLTYETPTGVYHSRTIGQSALQPSRIIIPIREVLVDPVSDLEIKVFNGEADYTPITVSMLAGDGEYSVSGWDSPSLVGENWSVRWMYNGQVFSVQWVGTLVTGPTRYIHILARQSPFEYGKDPLNRVLFSCNYDCRAIDPVANFIHEMAKLISDAGLGTDTVDLFIGPQVEIPSDTGPYTTLKQTGGFSPDESHDTKYLNLGLQVIVTALDYDLGDIKAKAIHSLLDGKRSFTVAV